MPEFQPVPEGVLGQIEESIRERDRKEKIRKRQQTEAIDIAVGKHSICGGEIRYRSSFIFSGSVETFRIGGKNPTKEIVVCSCVKCGTLFDPHFAPYREQVTAHRDRDV